MQAHRRIRQALAAGLFIALLPALPYLDQQLTRRFERGSTKVVEAYALPPEAIIRAMSFGYNELAADLLWIRSIGYYVDHLLGDRDARHMERYLKSVIALDERFAAIYRYAPSMLISGTGKRLANEVWAAIRILKRAARLYPDDWQYPFYLGCYYMTELGGTRPERLAYQREGAEWIHRAALLGAASPWLPALAANIFSQQGQRDLAIRHLQEIYVTTQDPEMRIQITGKLKHLQASKFLDDARAAAEAMEKAQKATGLPFVPPDLFGLFWLEPLQPFTLAR